MHFGETQPGYDVCLTIVTSEQMKSDNAFARTHAGYALFRISARSTQVARTVPRILVALRKTTHSAALLPVGI